MKKYLYGAVGFVMMGLLTSCGGDDPLPSPTVDFEFFSELGVEEIARPIQFINNTTNAASYSWDFGDETTSTEANPEHTYSAPGNYTVVLTAMTEDEQMDTLAQTVTVGQRFLTSLVISSIDFSKIDSDGNVSTWDVGSGPDIQIIFGPEDDPDFSRTIGSAVIPDLDEGTFQGITLTLNPESALTNENWVFVLLEDDSELGEGTEPELMIQTNPFNPVTSSNSFVNPDPTDDTILAEGSIQISGFGFDIFFIFEVK